MAADRPLMTGLFPDRDSAERGYNVLTERGYSTADVNLAMSDDTRKKHFAAAGTETELGNKAAEGAGVGGAIGGTIGAIAAAVAAVGTSLVIPGLGLVVARWPPRLPALAPEPPPGASSALSLDGAFRKNGLKSTRKASRRVASSWVFVHAMMKTRGISNRAGRRTARRTSTVHRSSSHERRTRCRPLQTPGLTCGRSEEGIKAPARTLAGP
jgi:hypothetical protein